ncbi:hypothetical protein [Plantactinospora sp. CA-290183]|uniref:hypothetical protein n=1 Tax=Plantactinospora sp. CA-290183 TaxID=3240006 RepID=UPI003D8F98A3
MASLARAIDSSDAGPPTGYDLDLDRLFETGLRALLDGFAALVARGGGPEPAGGTGPAAG